MPAKRAARNRGLPPNTFEQRDGYLYWRHPITMQKFGLGRNRTAAISQAVEANLHVAMRGQERLLDKIAGTASRTVANFVQHYESKLLPLRELAPITLNHRKYYGKLLSESKLGAMEIQRVETTDVRQHFLDRWRDAGHARSEQAIRAYLKDLWNSAIAEGWCKENPVLVTDRPRVKVQRARLTLEQFQAIYDAAYGMDEWAQDGMALALLTGQRREDLPRLRFADVREGFLHVKQSKSKNSNKPARLRIPLALTLDVLGWNLGERIRACRSAYLLSPYLLHHVRHIGRAKPGAPINPQRLTKAFKEARDLSGLTWPERDEEGRKQTPPSFHEIRSLAKRLYKEQGNVDTKALLGHRDDRTANLYGDPRGAEWITVKVG